MQEEVEGEELRFVPITAERAPKKRPRAEDDEPEDIPRFKYTAVPVLEALSVQKNGWPGTSPSGIPPYPPPLPTVQPGKASREQLAAIVARATEAAEFARAAEAQAAAAAEEAAEKKRLAKQRRKERAEKKEKEQERKKEKKQRSQDKAGSSSASTSKPADKDKLLLKLVGEVVVKYMSHYRDQMEHETFKKHAKEVSHRSPMYPSDMVYVTTSTLITVPCLANTYYRGEGEEVQYLQGRQTHISVR